MRDEQSRREMVLWGELGGEKKGNIGGGERKGKR